MSREPAYPKDAPVEAPLAAAAAAAAGSEEAGAKPADSRRRKQIMTGAAIGIGSAAIVAALLYANRGRRSDRG
jgi:predicted cobalt transporter CbtA